MMKLLLLSFFSFGLLLSCTTVPREIAAQVQVTPAVAFPVSLSQANCSAELSSFRRDLDQLIARQEELTATPEQLFAFENQNFEFRRKAVGLALPSDCVLQLRKVITSLRTIRDYIAEKIYEHTSQPALSFQLPKTALKDFAYRTGDILLTRGNSFRSAMIAKVATNNNHYSHIAYVYVDPKTKKVSTLESYPNTGARIYPIEKALMNENVRVQLLRPKDSTKAAAAVTFMHSQIEKALSSGKPINYDYAYNEKDHSRLSCVEVVQEAYLQLYNEKVPALPSQSLIQKKDFFKLTGVRGGDFVVPADFETDPRFEVLWEWTDFKMTADQRIKDVVLERMFLWVQKEDYKLQGNLKSLSTRMMLSFRNDPAVWERLSSKIDVKEIPMEIPSEILVTIVKSSDIGWILVGELNHHDQELLKSHGRHLTEKELAQKVERFRSNDRENFIAGRASPLHLLFRPSNMQRNFPE